MKKVNKIQQEGSAEKTNIKRNVPDFFGAFLLIAMGTLFLLNNFNILPWSIWGTLWRFWPILLIIGGIQVIIGRSLLGSIVAALIGASLVGLIIAAAVNSKNQDFDTWFNQTFPQLKSADQPQERGNRQRLIIEGNKYQEITDRKVKLELGAGKFDLNDTSDDYYLAVNSLSGENLQDSELKSTSTDNTIIIDFVTKGQPNNWLRNGAFQQEITVGRQQITTDFDINLGAGALETDFSKVNVQNFKIHVGAGSANLSFGQDAIPQQMDIDIGAGSLNLIVPRTTSLEVKYDVGLGNLNISGESMRGEGSYTTAGSESSKNKIEITIKIGVGNVNIRQSDQN